MKFFFPDSHDLVDPTFDFTSEQRRYVGSRQQSQLYAHEVFEDPPYDGMLVSRAAIDGPRKNVRYTFSQIQKLKRIGVRQFLRLDGPGLVRRMETMGDCGSFSFADEPEPPLTVSDLLLFYHNCQFDYGISLDHIIFGYDDSERLDIPEEWKIRFELTLSLANEFLKAHRSNGHLFAPIGAAQGWSPRSYQAAVQELQRIGYKYIALGGMVPLKTPEILACLEAVSAIRRPETKIHLLGITRLENIDKYERLGVYSFDSTSPLKRAFMDDRDNYHTLTKAYTALRIPQVGENPKLKKIILSGAIDFSEARKLEKACLKAVFEYDQGKTSIDDVLEHLARYDRLWRGNESEIARMRETLLDAPWRACSCQVCRELGINVVIFRGAERNRRRGFHNLYVLSERLRSSNSKGDH
jgi:hypothetical protein